MSGDYLKQLQLTKQLEQKTKEAAKNRKEAEGRLADAEKAISSCKSFDAPTANADRALEEASQAFQQKDYKLSLSLSQKAIEVCETSKSGKVRSILESAEALLKLFADEPAPSEITSTQKKARDLLEQGALDESRTKAQELWDAVERFVNAKVADMFSVAQSLVLMAEKLSLEVEGERQMLKQARHKLEKGNFGECVAQIKDCTEMASSALRNLFLSQVEAMNSAAERADELGLDFNKAQDTLAKAKASSEKGEFEQAFGTMEIAQSEAKAIVSKGLLSRLEGLKERTQVLKGMGLEAAPLVAATTKARELARSERIGEAMDAWREAEGLVRSQEIEQLLNMISKLRGRLLIANKIGSDIGEVMSELDAARRTLAQGDFKLAAALVTRAEKALEKALEGYKEVEIELTRTRSLMTLAIELKLNITEAKGLMDVSRQMVLRRDFGKAVDSLKQAQQLTHSAIQAHIGQEIMRAEMRVTTALKLGADIHEESAMLEDTVRRTKEGKYGKVREDLEECIHQVDAKVQAIAEKTLAEAKTLLDDYSGSVDVSPYRATLLQGQEALREGQPVRAYDLANTMIGMFKREELTALDSRLIEARHLLNVAREMGSESVTLNEKLNRAEHLRYEGDVAESLRITGEVVQFASSIIKDELVSQLAQLNKAINASRKNGMEVLQAERLAEESSRAVGKGDLLRGQALYKEAEATLERLTAVHNRIYERIVEISAMIKEANAQKLDSTKQAEMLLHAKRLFEAGKYEEALPAIAKTFVETEKLVAPFVAPRKAQAAQDMISAAKRLGFEVGAPQKRLDGALRLIDKKEYAQAMVSVREVEKTVLSVLTKGVEKELAEAKYLLEKARETGSDISGPQQIVEKAESLLHEKRIYDALRALELARNELDQGLMMSDKAKEALEQTQSIINDAVEFGVDVESARELLRQAKNYHKMGRHGIAHELARKAGDQVTLTSAEMVRERLRKAETEQRQKGLEGADLEGVLLMKPEIEKRIEARRFREAAAQVRGFEQELRRIAEQKGSTAKAIAELESQLSQAKSKGVPTGSIEPALGQAKERFAEGSYSDAYTLVSRCANELKVQLDLYARRQTELKELEEDLAELESEGVAGTAKELVEQAKRSIAMMDFEGATLKLRRAREAAKEAKEAIQAERMKNLENMCMLAAELKINKSSIPHVVTEVNQLRTSGKKPEPKQLRQAVDAMGEVMRKKLENRIEAIHEDMEEASRHGADVTTSKELLAKANVQMAEGKWRGAANCVLEAERSIGVAAEEQNRYIDLKKRVEGSIESARRNGLELTEAIGLSQEAEKARAKDHATALKKMGEAMDAATRAAEEFLPDIQVDLHFAERLKKGHWTKAKLNLGNEAKAMAREVMVAISGDMEMRGFATLPKLRGGERLSVDVEVRPKVEGRAQVTLTLDCRPVLSNDKVGYESEFEVDV
ncbi:MAG: hypothetical protein LUQ16_08040 [Methanomassiliicoccales archaeon]|nr:hypothetical protein [Methanomassiliicoccales archaeon]